MPYVPHPPEMGKIWPFWGRLKVFRPFSRMVQAPALKKKNFFLLKKRRRIQQKKRKTDRTPLRWRINLTDQTYDTEEVFIFVATRYLVSHIVQLTVLNCCSVLGSLALLLFRREFVPWIFHLALSCISDKGDDPTAGSSYSWDVACYQLVTEMYQVPGMR